MNKKMIGFLTSLIAIVVIFAFGAWLMCVVLMYTVAQPLAGIGMVCVSGATVWWLKTIADKLKYLFWG